ncbi:hypothetical protein ACLKA7_002778 [Drosophila subpalustris]
MQLTKGTFLLLTLCLSCAGSWASAVSETLITNLEDLAKTLTGNLTELDAVVTAETDPVKIKALNSGQTVLKGLYTNLENLQNELAEINDKINDTIGEQIETAITDLQTWGEEQLQRVNESTDGAGVPQANGLIANVINRYTSALPRTLNELNFLNRTFESNVNNAIDDYTKFARALIDQMNTCTNQTRNRCKDNIAILSAKVRTSTGRLNRIVRSGNQLVASGDRATKNFENLGTKLEKDQEKCENNLDRIIKLNPTTTTAATTSETTDESETTTSATTAESEATTSATTAESEATTSESTSESDAITSEITDESETTTIRQQLVKLLLNQKGMMMQMLMEVLKLIMKATLMTIIMPNSIPIGMINTKPNQH